MVQKLQSLVKNHKIELLILVLLYPLVYLLGCYVHTNDSAVIDREGKVYPRSGRAHRGLIQAINADEVILEDRIMLLDEVKRIDFYKTITKKELSKNEKRFVGRYRVTVGPYKGKLVFYGRKNGNLGGYIHFNNWGKKKREYLSRIRVRGKKIEFTRSCSGAKCSRIGSNSSFKQVYKGELKRGKEIHGTYGGNLSSGRFKAI